MPSEVAKPDSNGGVQILALTHEIEEVRAFISDNLAGQQITPFDLVRLSVPSGKAQTYRWEVPTLSGSEARDEVTGVIIHQQPGRSYWPQPLDTGGGRPPVCSAPDGQLGFGKWFATPNDPDPTRDPEPKTCASCPQSQWGSAADGRGQACKQHSSLFLLMETGFLPAVISVPPTSLGAVKSYMLALSNVGIRYDQVATTFALAKATNQGGTEYALLQPRLANKLDDDTATKARAYGDDLRPQLAQVAAQEAAGATPDPAPASGYGENEAGF